jgi:hypothetical protein
MHPFQALIECSSVFSKKRCKALKYLDFTGETYSYSSRMRANEWILGSSVKNGPNRLNLQLCP